MVLGHCTRPLRVPLEDHIRTCAPLLAFALTSCARQPICAGRWPRQNPPSEHSLISIHARGRLHIVFAMFLQVTFALTSCARQPICAGRWPRQNPPSEHSLISIHARGRLHIVFAMFLQVRALPASPTRQPICAGRWPRQNPPSEHSLISIHARGRLHIVFAMFLQVRALPASPSAASDFARSSPARDEASTGRFRSCGIYEIRRRPSAGPKPPPPCRTSI